MKIFAVLALLLFAGLAQAATVEVKWVAPTVCTDGSAAATNCPTTGFDLFQGASPTGTNYGKVGATLPATATSTIVTVAPGTRCFYMKTVSNTLTSAESNRICVDVPAPSPTAPVITVTITVAVAAPTP